MYRNAFQRRTRLKPPKNLDDQAQMDILRAEQSRIIAQQQRAARLTFKGIDLDQFLRRP